MEEVELAQIKFPNIRTNLIAYVSSLSDVQYQKNFWGKKDPKNPSFYDDFDESIHFLYDSTDIAANPSSWVGLSLVNNTEAELIKNFDISINQLFEKYGTDLSDELYMKKKEWSGVVDNAKALYDELTEVSPN